MVAVALPTMIRSVLSEFALIIAGVDGNLYHRRLTAKQLGKFMRLAGHRDAHT